MIANRYLVKLEPGVYDGDFSEKCPAACPATRKGVRALGVALLASGFMLLPLTALHGQASLSVNRLIYVAATGKSPTENCQGLMNVIGDIDDASYTNRYLIKLEPGVYDCGMRIVVLKDFVSLEGAGLATLVRGRYATVVELASNMELRSLRVENYDDENCSLLSSAIGGAFVNPSAVNSRIFDVHAESVLCPMGFGYHGDQISDVAIEHSEIRGAMGAMWLVTANTQVSCAFSVLQEGILLSNPGGTASCVACSSDTTMLEADCAPPSP